MVIDKTGEKPGTEWDMHKVLEDKEIDAVSIVTPNHWHVFSNMGLQAGKHVYVESYLLLIILWKEERWLCTQI